MLAFRVFILSIPSLLFIVIHILSLFYSSYSLFSILSPRYSFTNLLPYDLNII